VYNSSDDWKQHPSKCCTTCNVPLLTCHQIVKAHDVVIVKLSVENTSRKIRPWVNINSVPSKTLQVGDHVYELISSIHYASNKTASVAYCSVVSCNGKWVHCTYGTLKVTQWSKGSKDLSIFFYVCTLKSSPPSTSSHTAVAVENKMCCASSETQLSCACFTNMDGVSCYSISVITMSHIENFFTI